MTSEVFNPKGNKFKVGDQVVALQTTRFSDDSLELAGTITTIRAEILAYHNGFSNKYELLSEMTQS